MDYPYTATNRLHEPHAYMYSPYGGEAFLQGYAVDRIERLLMLTAATGTECSASEARTYAVLHALLGAEGGFPISRLTELLSTPHVSAEFLGQVVFPVTFPNVEPVNTAVMLDSLLNSFLGYSPESDDERTAMQWLDRLLQRFEVSKKLYTSYLPGFRSGSDSYDDASLYLQFALVLALAYAHRKELHYLSTLLKVNDLLLSLPIEVHARCSGGYALVLAIAVELHAVRRLAEKQGGDY